MNCLKNKHISFAFMITLLVTVIVQSKTLLAHPVQEHESVSWQEFNITLQVFEQVMLQQLGQQSSWLTPQSSEVWSSDAWKTDFHPYVQRIKVDPQSSIILWGDLHGSYNSLQKSLTTLSNKGYIDAQLRITDPSHRFVFLGDLVDRGPNGVEVLNLVMKLKITNPDNVIIVRGNHEDGIINEEYGFSKELRNKYNLSSEQLTRIYRIYDLLPVALYISSGQPHDKQATMLCTHGAYEVGFNPQYILQAPQLTCFQMINKLERNERIAQMDPHFKQALINLFGHPQPQPFCYNECAHELESCIPQSLTYPYTLGFTWHDIVDDSSSTIVDYRPGRGWVYGQDFLKYLFSRDSSESNEVIGMFRAHQHNGLMLNKLQKNKGILKVWDGLVYTIVSGMSAGGPEVEGTFALLVPGASKDDWKVYHGGDDFKYVN